MDSGTPDLAHSPSPSDSSTSPSQIPVQPDHFYPTPHVRPEPSRSRSPSQAYLDPDDDPYATRGIPVFKPTWKDFQDFEGYVTSIEPWGRKSGIVKIIPPSEWKDSLPSVIPQLANVKLRHPIAQHMIGSGGLFRQNNVEKRKTYTVREWADLCAKEDLRAPSLVLKERGDDGVKVAARRPPRGRRGRRKADNDEDEDMEDEAKIQEEIDKQVFEEPQQAEVKVEDEQTTSVEQTDRASVVPVVGPPTPVSLSDAKPTPNVTPPPSAASAEQTFLSTFDPSTSWLPPLTAVDDYTPEACRELERTFWRGCGIGDPALYGADMKGSLFTDETKAWNVASLPSPLSRLLFLTNQSLPGVNTPYLYFGMWRAAFAWHVEDMDLYSINYIHFGAPKVWWAIPTGKANAFERVMRSHFPSDSKDCRQFLRHKSYLVSPTTLANSSLRPNSVVQQQGEFVITFPRGYHAGFNLGLNCAESVNFALQGWEDIARRADWCTCEADSVRMDVDALLAEAAEAETRKVKAAKASAARKRKSDAHGSGTPTKKLKLSVSTPIPTIKIRVIEPVPPPPTKGCCLCPSSADEGLLRVHDVPDWMRKGRPNAEDIWAHDKCALVLPETWITSEEEGGEDMVFGVDAIEKARWDLKCTSCTRPSQKAHGAKIQCTRGKCSRAFHVSCARDRPEIMYTEEGQVQKEVVLAPWAAAAAAAAGQSVDGGHIEPSIPEGEEPKQVVVKTVTKLVVDVLCSTHNPDVLQAKKQRKDEERRKNVMELKEGERIRVRVSSGVFEVTLVRIEETEEKVVVAWDDGSGIRELKWGSIVWGVVSEATLAAAKIKQQELAAAKPQRLVQPPTLPTKSLPEAVLPLPNPFVSGQSHVHSAGLLLPAGQRSLLPRIPKKSALGPIMTTTKTVEQPPEPSAVESAAQRTTSGNPQASRDTGDASSISAGPVAASQDNERQRRPQPRERQLYATGAAYYRYEYPPRPASREHMDVYDSRRDAEIPAARAQQDYRREWQGHENDDRRRLVEYDYHTAAEQHSSRWASYPPGTLLHDQRAPAYRAEDHDYWRSGQSGAPRRDDHVYHQERFDLDTHYRRGEYEHHARADPRPYGYDGYNPREHYPHHAPPPVPPPISYPSYPYTNPYFYGRPQPPAAPYHAVADRYDRPSDVRLQSTYSRPDRGPSPPVAQTLNMNDPTLVQLLNSHPVRNALQTLMAGHRNEDRRRAPG